MNFFFDRNMAPRLAQMIDVLEPHHTIRHHNSDGRFNSRTKDTEWIAALGGDDPKWTIVNFDGAILREKAERAALREAKLTFVWLSKGFANLSIYELSWRFLRVWPDILETAANVREPTVFEIPVTAAKLRRVSLTRDL